MPKHCGVVTLPDGREFRATSTWSAVERDTGAANFIDIDIEDMDGNPLDADAYNEEVAWPSHPDGKLYLWEAVDEIVCQFPPEDEDFGYD